MDIVKSPNAPAAIGPYAQAIRHNGLIYCSGQLPLDPATMQFVPGDVSAQTEQVLKNMRAILTQVGSSLDKVLKTTVFLKNMSDFVAMNTVYAASFGTHTPARSTVEVARLPKDALVEIECIAAV